MEYIGKTLTGAALLLLGFVIDALTGDDRGGTAMAILLYIGAGVCFLPVCVELIRDWTGDKR